MSSRTNQRFLVPARIGTIIGSAFGVVFVLVNSGAPLPSVASWALRLAGLACLVWILAPHATRSPSSGRPGRGNDSRFGAAFWLVVAAEVIVGELGLFEMHSAHAPWQANVAWVATVVGAHFGFLAWIWREPGLGIVAAFLTVLGVLGLVLAATATAVVWIPAISGVTSGLVLLSGGLLTSTASRDGGHG